MTAWSNRTNLNFYKNNEFSTATTLCIRAQVISVFSNKISAAASVVSDSWSSNPSSLCKKNVVKICEPLIIKYFFSFLLGCPLESRTEMPWCKSRWLNWMLAIYLAGNLQLVHSRCSQANRRFGARRENSRKQRSLATATHLLSSAST